MKEMPTFQGSWLPSKLIELDLRDYFAGLALQGRLANPTQYQVSNEHIFARDAYVLADEMMKARGEK